MITEEKIISKNDIQKEINFLYNKLEYLEDMLYINNNLQSKQEILINTNNFKKLIWR